MRPTDKATGDSRSVQSFVIIKNTGDGNFVNDCFHTRARNGLSARLRLALNRRPLPHRHPFSDFFLGKGAAVHRLSETDNPYPNCPSKLTDKVMVDCSFKIKPFHFQTKTYYVSDANYQTDNPSHANHPSLV